MQRVETINPDRISWCCAERGITPEELAKTLQISESTFQSMMEGRGGITFKQLQRLATYFNRGVLFFLETDAVVEETVHTAQFRTITNQKPGLSPRLRTLIERVERQRDIYLGLLEELGDEEQRAFSPPELPANNIPQAANIVRTWLALGDRNSFDSYRQAVEAKAVLVFRSNGYNGPWQISKEDPVCGFTLYHTLYPVIVIKKQPTESRQTFTLMHELGHLLLHKDSYVDEEEDLFSYQGSEAQANSFAGQLLVPNDFLHQVDDQNRPDDVRQFDIWLRPYREAWGVSGEVILRRLLDSNRLTQTDYEGYRRWRSTLRLPEEERGNRQYRYREPKHVFGDPFVQAVLDALHAKQISLARASTYLDNLRVADVHQLEGYCASL
jgi:Zn-dependent peptidase ImmA (M78 family)/transcriptional regulator with XRE-family HTH domain